MSGLIINPYVFAGGFGAPVEIWTAAQSATVSLSNRSHRNVAESLSDGGAQVRVTFAASGSASTVIDNASVGIRDGSTGNTTATPVELLFSGASGVTITAGNSIVSDWASLSFLSSDDLIVVIDYGSSGGADLFTNSRSPGSYFKLSADSYNVASPAGFSFSANTSTGMTKIEARS